jgi:hypothetical protein
MHVQNLSVSVFICVSISEVLILVTMKITISWDVMRFGLVDSNQTAWYHMAVIFIHLVHEHGKLKYDIYYDKFANNAE